MHPVYWTKTFHINLQNSPVSLGLSGRLLWENALKIVVKKQNSVQ